MFVTLAVLKCVVLRVSDVNTLKSENKLAIFCTLYVLNVDTFKDVSLRSDKNIPIILEALAVLNVDTSRLVTNDKPLNIYAKLVPL